MSIKTEGRHPAEFILSEADGTRSREAITVLDGQNVVAGEVLGQQLLGTPVPTADGGNTGNGTMDTPVTAALAQAGDYTVEAIALVPTTWEVRDPQGNRLENAVSAVAYANGQIGFTLTEGGTGFAVGDKITLNVPEGSLKYVAYNQDALDGSQRAAGISFGNYDALTPTADVPGVALTRDAEVAAPQLTWPADIEAAEQALAEKQLAAGGIIVRAGSVASD